MSSKTDLSIEVGGLKLASPVIIASGVWPQDAEFWSPGRLEGVGALCTKAVGLKPRAGNKGPRVHETPCGVLNSVGLQNTGMASFVKNYLPVARCAGRPFLVNLIMESEREVRESLAALRDVPDVPAVELNISCPNVEDDNMEWGLRPEGTALAVRIARSEWGGPLWVKLTPQSPYLAAAAKAAEDEGADAVVCGNTWLGMAMDIERRRPVFQRIVAGLSGPAVFPLALRTVWQVSGAVSIPVIGCGGVSCWRDAAAMLMAGASAVEVGAALFTDLELPRKIADGLSAWMAEQNIDGVSGLVGLGRR
ncbi:MAG: Dihydroorotate dehydrogenase B (NAD(+)), catalytic subunit [Synergistetes bacterium ADurb.BinA166]|nr:MAG: Dihydroorotate dehydrogenase B (NAD(+)), catalytic subunit [Synergistetes bacterium ADurb.BinA166]